jgi:CBS domain-containing protein
MRVQEFMTTDVVTATPDEPAWTAGEEMVRLEISGLPVVDAERQIVGVLSQIDLIRALRRGVDLRTTPVKQLMQPYTKFVTPDTDLDTAIDILDQWQIHRLPVCRDGRLVGIVTRGDVLRILLVAARPSQS